MLYNKDIHHRRSIRLQDFDYSEAGAYFVTVCTWNRECLFGDIVNGEMCVSDAGEIVTKTWDNLPNHYGNVALDEFVIMPNHIHGIIVLQSNIVGAGFKPALLNQNRTKTNKANPKQGEGPKQGGGPNQGGFETRPYGKHE